MTADVSGRSPTIRLVLGRKLRELRMAAGIDPAQIARMKLGSPSTTSRLETGKVPVLPHKVVALCKVYGVDRATTDELEQLAFRAGEESILDEHSDVIPHWFSIYVQLEAAASRIRTWQPDVMPGLLQTASYAREVFRASRPAIADDVVERLVETRRQRQLGVLQGGCGAQVEAVLGADVLVRDVGGAQARAEQVDHLRSLSAAGSVTVRVLPWSAGAHAAMTGQFTLLTFDDPDLTEIAYIESAAGARYLDKQRQLPPYRESFSSIWQQSIPLEEFAP